MADRDLFQLTTLDDLHLADAAGQVLPLPERGLLVLVYLRLKDQHAERRDVLSRLLWPGVDAATAYSNLRSTLWRMRAICGAEALLTTDKATIRLNVAKLRCDLDIFSAPVADFPALENLAHLLHGAFLPNIACPDDRFRDWVIGQRIRFLEKLHGHVVAWSARASDPSHCRIIRKACILLLEMDPRDNVIQAILASATRHDATVSPRWPGAGERQGTREGSQEGLQGGALSVARPSGTGEIMPPGLAMLPQVPRIALLPPTTSNAGSLLDTIGTALIEDVTIGLCSLRTLSVVAPYTALRIRQDGDMVAILKQQSVVYALDTKISDRGLFAQLIFLPADEMIWAERFSLEASHLAEQRIDIARTVTRSVAHQIEQNLSSRVDYARHPEAYHSYLMGARQLSELSLQQVRKARRQFKDSLRYCGDFAPSMSGIARTLTSEWLLTARGDDQLLQRAEGYAQDAIRRDETSAAAHRELGVARLYRGQIDESVEALAHAERLSPQYADVVYSYADTLVHASRPGEALVKIEKAILLNPLSPDAYFWTAAGASYFMGEYAAALGYIERMKDTALADRIAAASHAMLGNMKKAKFHRLRSAKTNPTFDIDTWLSVVPFKEQWQRTLYREGMFKAGF